MQLPIIFNDRYQLNTKLGEGGLAEVYLAQDLALVRLVAVKLLRVEYTSDPSFLVRFHREAQSAASLNSANVVSVYDFGQDHNRPYIVMEYVAGEDLRSVIDRGLLTVDQVVEYSIQMCNGVGMAHRRGMVHGDLKPGNILISPENRAKVTDFGLARALGESAMDDGELVWGTPAYFAPEQAAGDRVMPATDVYALGVILYELLTGNVPFVGDDDQDVARKQLYEYPTPIAKKTHRVPPALDAIVIKALSKNPSYRYHTADQLKQTLQQFQQQQQMAKQAAQQAPPPFAPPQSRRDRNVDVLSLVLAIIALLAVIGLIPLWVQVYRAWSVSSFPAGMAPIVTPTLAVNQHFLPQLIGFNYQEAEAILAGLGLSLAISDYQLTPDQPPFVVLAQEPPTNSIVDQGETVYVVVSQGQDLTYVPNVAGMPILQAERQLKTNNLGVTTEVVWSEAPPGTVLTQNPDMDTIVMPNSEVRLKISGGTKVATAINFDNQILLTAYEMPTNSFRLGETIDLTLFWQALRRPLANYEVLLQLTDRADQVVVEYQSSPVSGQAPTSDWLPDRQIIDPYQLQIPTYLPVGEYNIRLGLIEPVQAKMLPMESTGKQKTPHGTVQLQTIRLVN